jgi:hypothetical protein
MRIPTLLLALSLLAAGTPSLADCVDGQRAATAEEQAFADKLKAALKSALPAAPAPLYLEYEPVAYAGTGLCKGTPIGQVKGMVTASYTASGNYTDRVELKLRTNYAYYGDKDEVIGTLPKNPAAFKVHNLVIKVDGHKPEYVAAVKQALDREQLKALIEKPLPDTPPPVAWTVGKPAAPKAPAAAEPSPKDSAAARNAPPAAAGKSEPAPAAPDPARAVTETAKDAVNKLRGLFGR